MNIQMFALRDSNWFTNFPTTVSWAEYFYSYTRGSSSDGVIALDMHVVSEMLKVLGPVHVDSVNIPITSENVGEYLRSAEKAKPKGMKRTEWNRKQFIAELAQPIFEKILNARGQTWSQLVPVLLNLLDEKHILLQFDNEEMTALLARRNWDGAVRIPKDGDYLMAVDTNMGYNKSNAVMKMALDYSVDLTDVKRPASVLSIRQTNLSTKEIVCEPYATGRYFPQEVTPGKIPDPIYNIDECHSGYIRVYLPAGTQLTGSNPQEIPDTATMLGKTIPARTDNLGSEDIPNAQVFGMMTLTPTKSTTLSQFEYILPTHVVAFDEANNLYIYRLRIQKQPGIVSNKFVFSVRLPESAKVENASISLSENFRGDLEAQIDLRQDTWIEIHFRME
jgi:hypothetical protein